MAEQLTKEQLAAVQTQGKLIVSASAGSGKTFVMIKKLADLIENGASIDEVLAVTFTTKAAAQMKEKLRSALIDRIISADEDKKLHLKEQLSKIPSASVSTIHSFCSQTLRTYFYALDFDSSFEIITDASDEKFYMNKALEQLFDRLYELGDVKFLHLLSRFKRKRSDANLKKLVIEAFKCVKNTVDYRKKLSQVSEIFCEQGFNKICAEHQAFAVEKLERLKRVITEFRKDFNPSNIKDYDKRFDEMLASINKVIKESDVFAALPKLSSNKPADVKGEEDKGERYKNMRKKVGDVYNSLYDFSSRQTELENFIKSGETITAFCWLVLQFDDEYAQIKREEGKLDFADLEQYTLELLQREEIANELKKRYKYVYVDEYQDVNPVQEKILNLVSDENVFMVGDIKQAIYGFRGSKSLFFAEKFGKFENGDGHALKLSNNFRSSDGVLNFVNRLFSSVMREETCAIDYKKSSIMLRGDKYPQGDGYAKVHVIGKNAANEKDFSDVYSVAADSAKKSQPSREGLAVVQIVKQALNSQYFDLKEGKLKSVTTGDICILTRKRKNDSVTGIVRALTESGFAVSGAQDSNVCNRPEVKKMLDILSYIDNSEQDIPLVTALLSPLGKLSENELAQIKLKTYQIIKNQKEKGERIAFREECERYAQTQTDKIAKKLIAFYGKIEELKNYSELFGAASIIDKILKDTGWEAQYSRYGGLRLKNVRKLAAEAYSAAGELSLYAFLQKLKAGEYKVDAPESSSAESIKILTMHASKGLEFPIVILSDVNRTYKGDETSEILYDDDYGFAFKFYDDKSLTKKETLLTKLLKLKERREEYKNEANLYYVACTRAMYGLHVLTSEIPDFIEPDVFSCGSYTKMGDLSIFDPEYMQINAETDAVLNEQILISEPDEDVLNAILSRFNKPYSFKESVDLPVKSSASQVMKILGEDEPYATKNLFPTEMPEGSTSIESGIVYHRFLELCDFNEKSKEGVAAELNGFIEKGLISKEQAERLNVEKLYSILNMPVFEGLNGATLYREREFLCRLPANEFLPTSAEDGVLVQGAIDLLVFSKNGCRIIDYKYSKKSDEQIKKEYAPQLSIYKKAVSIICKIDESTIKTDIVNIFTGSVINIK